MSTQGNTSLKNLYQGLVLDHSRQPRNFRQIANASFVASGHNPLCGDEVSVAVKWAEDVLADIAFQGQGCAISMASASMMTQILKSKHRGQVIAVMEAFHEMLTVPTRPDEDRKELGKLLAFQGVQQYPSRVKCATLPWHTLKACLDEEEEVVGTE